MEWRDRLGNIDVYLFDQLLKGRLRPGMRVLDAGCGSGRHLTVLEREGFDWRAVDRDPAQLEAARQHLHALGARDVDSRLRVSRIEALSDSEEAFDYVICVAVLHFVASDAEFTAAVDELWRVLSPGGQLFVRTASTIGLEATLGPRRNEPVDLPDGSRRFLVDAATLHSHTRRLDATLVDPIRTSVVDAQRAMTTWVIAK